MNQLPENSLHIYDVTLVTSYLIGLSLDVMKVVFKHNYVFFSKKLFLISILFISNSKDSYRSNRVIGVGNISAKQKLVYVIM